MKKNERDSLAKSVGTELVGAANSTFFAMGAKWSEYHPNWKEDMPKRSENENGLPKLYLCQILTLDMTFGYRYSYRVGFITKEGFERIVDTSYFPARNIDDVITHELDGHKRHWDMVKKFYNDNLDRYSSLEDAKQDYERSFRNYIVKQQSSDYFYVRRNISENAFIGLEKNGQINEAVADCDVLYRKGEILDNELKTLFKELMGYDG